MIVAEDFGTKEIKLRDYYDFIKFSFGIWGIIVYVLVGLFAGFS